MSDRKAKIPLLTKAEFREKARAIVQKDRDQRRHGLTVNTAGEIALALERAYREGYQAALSDEPQQGGDERRELAWIEIPPRPRATFESLCNFSWRQPRAMPEYVVADVALLWWPPLKKWFIAGHLRDPSEKGKSDQSVQILIRLGLLTVAERGGQKFAFVSREGWECWQRYLEENPTYPTW